MVIAEMHSTDLYKFLFIHTECYCSSLRLTDMLRLPVVNHLGPQVPSDRPLENFQQESEHGLSQSCIPTALGFFVTNERVLGLDFEDLVGK